MTSESKPVRKNHRTPHGSGEPDIETDHTDPQIASGLPPSGIPPSHAHYKITCEKDENWWGRNKHWAEIAGIILLAVYTGYTVKMYSANKEAADAAKSSAEVNKSAVQRGQRAFVYFSEHLNPIVIVDPRENAKITQFQFTIPLKNSGTTPPVGLIFRVNTYPSQDVLSDNFPYPDGPNAFQQLTVLGPSQDTVSQPVGVSPEIIKGVQDRLYASNKSRQRLYFYGWARYWDIFQDRKIDPPHITKFCYELTQFSGNLTVPEVTKVHTFFTDCPHHNCTDEDCNIDG